MKYKDWLAQWLELYVKPTSKERTYKKYKKQVESHKKIESLKDLERE
jgi:hypothetical protein